MTKPMLISNKKVCEKVYSFKAMLSKKLGKPVTTPKALDVMFSDDNIMQKISNSQVKKKGRSKKEYVFKI